MPTRQAVGLRGDEAARPFTALVWRARWFFGGYGLTKEENHGAKVIPALAWGDPQGVPLSAVLVAAVSGVLVAWRWELLGGLLALLGGTDMIVGAIVLTLPLALAGIPVPGRLCPGERAAGRQDLTVN
jgi:hypothetical protein